MFLETFKVLIKKDYDNLKNIQLDELDLFLDNFSEKPSDNLHQVIEYIN